jgi:GNAT superfamily N-acetyltransferase
MVSVRIANDDDLGAVAALRIAWLAETGETEDEASFRDRLANWWSREREHRLIFLAELDGAAVGMLNLMLFERMPSPGRPPTSWGYVGNVFVPRTHRAQGIGTAMMTELTAYADGIGLVRLVLSPSERSVSLYRRAGFGVADTLMVRKANE